MSGDMNRCQWIDTNLSQAGMTMAMVVWTTEVEKAMKKLDKEPNALED